MSYRTPTLSSEEEDALHRSTKKIKEGHTPSSPEPPFQNLRYKAKPVVQLPGAYKNAFSLVDQMHEDAESGLRKKTLKKELYPYLFLKRTRSALDRNGQMPSLLRPLDEQ